MASLSLNPSRERQSALLLKQDLDIPRQVWNRIDWMLEERSPFRRRGYPRAGAFDRLGLLAFAEAGPGSLAMRFWLPGPRLVLMREARVRGTLGQLLRLQSGQTANALVLAAWRSEPGTLKYGEKNLSFARTEQGVFLEALHEDLCRHGIANHLQGGLALDQTPVRLPVDWNEPLGLLA